MIDDVNQTSTEWQAGCMVLLCRGEKEVTNVLVSFSNGDMETTGS